MTLRTLTTWLAAHRRLVMPLAVAALVVTIVAPLPAWLVDVLLAANLAGSAILLLISMDTAGSADLRTFPSVLLASSAVRLGLHLATTRLILSIGSTGGADNVSTAAGTMIWAFGNLVAGSSLVAAVVVAIVLSILQFAVITRGAARIAEVAARFVLDAMPGKQMAIDSDLKAGVIDADEARDRRLALDRQADFHGAMDGASRFLRGDAAAAVAITAVAILGGLYVGHAQLGWAWGRSLEVFGRLAVGQALVMQIPSLLVAVSAALAASRGAGQSDATGDVIRRLKSRPAVLGVTAAMLVLLAFTSLPKAPLLLIGSACAVLAWVLSRGNVANDEPQDILPQTPVKRSSSATSPAAGEGQDFETLLSVDPMRLELGYAVVALADPARGGDLLDRIATMRRRVAEELGLLVPPIRIRDELRLDAHSYVIRIRGEKIASGKIYPNQMMALPPGEGVPAGELIGRRANDPLGGGDVVWISSSQRQAAEAMGYCLLPPGEALMRHLEEIVRRHGGELLSWAQTTRMLELIKARGSGLVAEATDRLRVGQIQKVLQNLLREGVPIRDLETILEALAEASVRTSDVRELSEIVRGRLARTLSRRHCDEHGRLRCVCLAADLEETLQTAVQETHGGSPLPTDLSEPLLTAVGEALDDLARQGRRPVLLCSPQVRPAMHRLLSASRPGTAVLAYNEIESVDVEAASTVRISQ